MAETSASWSFVSPASVVVTRAASGTTASGASAVVVDAAAQLLGRAFRRHSELSEGAGSRLVRRTRPSAIAEGKMSGHAEAQGWLEPLVGARRHLGDAKRLG